MGPPQDGDIKVWNATLGQWILDGEIASLSGAFVQPSKAATTPPTRLYEYDPLAWGIVGDGVTDDWNAWTVLVAILSTGSNPVGNTIRLPDLNAGGNPFLSLCSKSLHIPTNVHLLGESGMPWNFGGSFKFSGLIHGLIIDSGAQHGSTGAWGDMAVLENIAVTGAGSAPTTRAVTDAVTTATSTTLTSATANFVAGDVGKALGETNVESNTAGSDFLYCGTYIQSVTNSTTVVLSMPAFASGSGIHLTIGAGSAVCCPGKPTMKQVAVIGHWGGHGVYISANTSTAGNANEMYVEQVWVDSPTMDGFRVCGTDANAITFISCGVVGQGGIAFSDESQLGNTWVGCHADKGSGVSFSTGQHATGNSPTLIGCYNEGGGTVSAPTAMIIGGRGMSGQPGVQANPSQNAIEIYPVARVDNNTDGNTWVQLGAQAANSLMQRWGSTSPAQELRVYWGLNTTGDFEFRDLQSGLTAIAFTTSTDTSARGGGIPKMANGLFLNGYKIVTNAAAVPSSGTWATGDFVFNTAAAVAGAGGSQYIILGWYCTAGGTPGTWVQCRTLTGT